MAEGLNFNEALAMAMVEYYDDNYQEARKWALAASGVATTDEQLTKLADFVRKIPESK